MRLLVTGAGGLVGKLLVELARERHDVLGLGHGDLDVTDRTAVSHSIRGFSPHAVLHCAAYTDVDGAEREPERAMEVNADGSQWVTEAARAAGAVVAYVSTDYVFDGESKTPYKEDAATNPLSSYGRSKLEGERRVTSAAPEQSICVRTGWLYGKGKGFVDWARGRLLASEEMPLVQDQTGSPTYARELAEAILRLVEGQHRGLFHFVNQGEASWLELGRVLSEELKIAAPRLKPISSDALGRPAPRPSYSALSVDRYERATGRKVRAWREALARYLTETER